MSVPSKPWGTPGPSGLTNGFVDERHFGPRPSAMGGAVPMPPPLPPRRRAAAYSSPFGGYSSPYGGDYYGSSFGMPYSSMSYRSPFGAGYGYGGMGGVGGMGGYGADDPSSPFQGVESIVRAISSLSMMMESTYQSMYMSFRAVLGVAENMDRLRRVVLDLFGSLALFKTVVWFCKKILYLLGIIGTNPIREKLWEAAAAEVSGAVPKTPNRRTWPLIAFFSLMLGGPYVLYKLAVPPTDSASFDPNLHGGVKCVALYDFETNQKGELPFRRGDVLIRHKTAQGGWARAMNKARQIGLVPVDRLKPISTVQQKSSHKPVNHQFYPAQAPNAIIHPSDTHNATVYPEDVDLPPAADIAPEPDTSIDPTTN